MSCVPIGLWWHGRSPTTTGKVERWHKTLRREFLNGRIFESIEDAQAQLDGWVRHYNQQRPHQAIGRVPPVERFRLAVPKPVPVEIDEPKVIDAAGPPRTRRVSAKGTIGFATASYKAGVWLAGQTVEVVCDGGLVQLHHRGVLIATRTRRGRKRMCSPPANAPAAVARPPERAQALSYFNARCQTEIPCR